MVTVINVQIYRAKNGKSPFSDWLKKLGKTTQAIIDARIARVRAGNFGDSKHIKNSKGLFELRIDLGPGYRVYYGLHGNDLVILLCGGDKTSQDRDIEKAKTYWIEYINHF